jgi:hypothetical protein
MLIRTSSSDRPSSMRVGQSATPATTMTATAGKASDDA